MKVYIEVTESPNIIKLKSDETLVHGSYEIDRSTVQNEIPVANHLLKFPFIKKVFITANFIALEKTTEIDWVDVIDDLKNIVNSYLDENPSLIVIPKKEPFTLYSEMTPNPEVIKFVSNKMLTKGMLEVKTKDETTQIPLASYIFTEDCVKEVFILENYISITKTESSDWAEITNPLRIKILDYLQSGQVISHIDYFSTQKPIQKIERKYSEIEQKIKDILEEYVNPAVSNDGGNIELIEYDATTKTARMLLQGACSGCPSSTMTLKNGIQTMLQNFLPNEVENVEAINN